MLIVYLIVCLGTESWHVAQAGLELPIHLPEPQQPCLTAHLKSKAVPRDPIFPPPQRLQGLHPGYSSPTHEFCTPSRSQMACGALNHSHSLIITQKFNFHILRVVNNLKVIFAFSPTPASVWKHVAGASEHGFSVSDGPLPFPLQSSGLIWSLFRGHSPPFWQPMDPPLLPFTASFTFRKMALQIFPLNMKGNEICFVSFISPLTQGHATKKEKKKKRAGRSVHTEENKREIWQTAPALLWGGKCTQTSLMCSGSVFYIFLG